MNGHKDNDQILGAAGMDFKLGFIEYIVQTEVPECEDADKMSVQYIKLGYVLLFVV